MTPVAPPALGSVSPGRASVTGPLVSSTRLTIASAIPTVRVQFASRLPLCYLLADRYVGLLRWSSGGQNRGTGTFDKEEEGKEEKGKKSREIKKRKKGLPGEGAGRR